MAPFFAKIKKLFESGKDIKLSPLVKDVFVGAFIGFVIACISAFGYLQKFEYITLDSMYRLRGEESASEDIAIVEIEDSSLEILGKWPWPREYHATFLQILNSYSPKSVVFDVLFPEADPEGDKALAMAAVESKNLYLAAYFDLEDRPKKVPSGDEPGITSIPYFNYKIKDKDKFPYASGITLPVKPLLNAAKGSVIVNAPPDTDGSTRHLPLVIESGGRLYPTLGLHLACDYLGVNTDNVVIKPGSIILPLDEGNIEIPIDSGGRMILNFNGPIERFERYSFIQLLHDYNKALKTSEKSLFENLRDKVVFIGHTATGSVDLRIMPFSNFYPAVGIHATALGNIIEGDMMRATPTIWNVFIILTMSILLSLLVKRGKKVYVNLSIMAILFLSYMILSYLFFVFLNLWFYTFAPLITVLLAYVAISINHYETVRHEKKILENELLIARTIQQSFLPKSYPRVPFLEFAARCNPAKQIGGDLYDFVQLGDDKIGVVIGDVSGKGVPAALYMARAVSEFRTRSHLSSGASSTLESLNNAFASEGMEKAFITMQYLIVDLKTKKLFFSNGGHNTILHFIKDANKVEELDTEKGMPIGILEGTEFDDREIPFETGDILFLYTDGISEAMDKKHKEFGLERVKDILVNNQGMKAGDIVTKLLDEIAKFSKGAPQHDDMTAIVMRAV